MVIIGLIVGGVLVGQSLIGAATVRAQISQIEKYNTAANTFREKYSYLPGDITAASAAQFGLVARAGSAGRGDGNGELDGWGNSTVVYSYNQNGENLFFWEDLSSAQLIGQTFSSYVDGTQPSCAFSTCNKYFPTAKIGGGNVIYTYSGYASQCCPNDGSGPNNGYGPNFFGLSAITSNNVGNVGNFYGGSSTPGLTVAQAYAIDQKIDDGMPTTGNVLAQYLSNGATISGAPGWAGNGASPTASTCYDTSTGVAAYSMTMNNGKGVNCALSFKIQAGD